MPETPEPTTPRYRVLADELRRRIRAGIMPAGSALPSESALRKESGHSSNTIRQAVAQLRNEGLVYTEQGRATFVRPEYSIKRVGMDRYRVAASVAAGTTTAEPPPDAAGTQTTFDHSQVPAGDVAPQFGVAPGTMLVRRVYTIHAYGHVREVTTSYLPLDLVAGTPLADHAAPDGDTGVISQLAGIGVKVTAVEEVKRARMPDADEAKLLTIVGVAPVLAVTRRMFAGDRVVEVAQEIVYPGDRVELIDRLELDWPG